MITPIFIYGALRSGSTVFRLMLRAHPEIANPGEMDFLFDHLRQGDDGAWRYDFEALAVDRIYLRTALTVPPGLDGRDLLEDFLRQIAAREAGLFTLNIHRNISRLAELFPEAKVIHLLRDPRDVARSSIGMGWAGTLYYGVGHWIETEKDWDAASRILRSENVLTVRYEDLFRDVESELVRVCSFLNLSYEASMLNYHRNSTYEPPDPSLVEQWRRKATPRELGMLEARIGALLATRGYAPSGYPPVRLRRPAQMRLWVEDRLARWRFGIRKYGVRLFFSAFLARKLGFISTFRRLKLRMNAVDAQNLK